MSPMAQPATVRKRHRLPSREDLVDRAMARLSVPRVQMIVLLSATGGAGFLASYGMLQLGVDEMAIRYPLAVAFAYLVFFLLLRLWLAFQLDPEEYVADGLDAGLDVAGEVAEGVSSWGGRGGGSSTSFEASAQGPSVDFGLPDLDDMGILIFLIVAAAVAAMVLGAVIYVIYLAPLLLAEVLVDGLLLVGLYKRLKGPEPEYWMFGAIKRTWVAAILVAVTFFFAGVIFQSLAPEARSIGGVWKTVSSDSSPAGSP